MWTCESIRPGIAVIPPASTTTSAASISAGGAVPTRSMRLPSVTMVSPTTKGARQSPETICPRLMIATFMTRPLRRGARQFALHVVGGEQPVDQSAGILPIEGAQAVAAGDKARAGVKHLILRMSGTELGADGIPRRLEKFHLLLWLHRRRSLGLIDDCRHV